MKTTHILQIAVLSIGASGCSTNFCEDIYKKDHPDVDCDNLGAGGASSSTTASMGSMTTASMMQSSSSTGVLPTCTPSDPTWSPSAECGVFVKLGETGTGTPEAPLGSVPAAVAAAMGRPIYIAEGIYEGAISLPSGAVVFGGLKSDWSFDAAVRPTLTAPADEIPVKLLAGTSETALHHLRVEARAAEAEGGSSVAMVIAETPSVLDSVDLVSGNAKNGASSTTPTDVIGPTVPTDAAIRGNDGSSASTTDPDEETDGADPKSNPICGTSVGGKGGDGGSVLAGAPGSPQDAGDGSAGQVFTAGCMGGTCGLGGPGQDTVGQSQCAGGEIGKNGDDGMPGIATTALGTLSLEGYQAPPPDNGTDGQPGQGGGGGGGAMGKIGPDTRGASGGSGGAGGCGGHGAPGGGAGGSSIALVVLGEAPTMTAVTLTIGDAGDGGTGADGQFGVTGGAGGGPGLGMGTSNACRGGDGGQGGDGGHGAGGRGGHAIGIAYNGIAPSGGFTLTAPGVAGEGGPSNGAMGTPGEGTEMLDFVP